MTKTPPSALDAALARLAELHPKKIDLSLGRIERLLETLGEPQNKLTRVIHVAGTNGKGSVIAFLSAIARAAGLSVNAYTSPHLVHFNERIVIGGAPITDDALTALLDRVEAANAGAPITFFEVTTAAAFLAFSETPADLTLVETGLGGRFDATNVIAHPACAVITTIGLDHEDFLGGDIARIAWEKAGILKSGAPAVIGLQDVEPRAAIAAEAHALGVAVQMWGRDYAAREENGRLVYETDERVRDLPTPSLAGGHQAANAGLAIAAAIAVFDPSDDAIARGLETTEWPARLQKIESGPLLAHAFHGGEGELWIDGAHNPLGAAALARALADLDDRTPRPLVIILGLQKNKDAKGILSAFHGLARGIICTPLTTSSAGADANELAREGRILGIDAESAQSLIGALGQVSEFVADNEPSPRVVICGSLYLAGEALALNEGRARTPTAG